MKDPDTVLEEQQKARDRAAHSVRSAAIQQFKEWVEKIVGQVDAPFVTPDLPDDHVCWYWTPELRMVGIGGFWIEKRFAWGWVRFPNSAQGRDSFSGNPHSYSRWHDHPMEVSAANMPDILAWFEDYETADAKRRKALDYHGVLLDTLTRKKKPKEDTICSNPPLTPFGKFAQALLTLFPQAK